MSTDEVMEQAILAARGALARFDIRYQCCGRPMRGFYGAASSCGRPKNHDGDCYQVYGSLPEDQVERVAIEAAAKVLLADKPVDVRRETITHWQVVDDADGGISYSTSSQSDGRWGITKAQEWLEKMRDFGNSVHLEVWEQTYGVTPDVWRRVS